MTTNPKGAGRKPGSTKDRAKINTTISRENAEWLRSKKKRGFSISAMLDRLIEEEVKTTGANKLFKELMDALTRHDSDDVASIVLQFLRDNCFTDEEIEKLVKELGGDYMHIFEMRR